MLRLAPHLPDSAVGLLPVPDRTLDEALDPAPRGARELLGQSLSRVDRDRVDEHAPHVVLALVVRPVPDPHRLRPAVAVQVVERRLGELALAADPVHDLQLGLGRLLDQERVVLVRLPVEAEREQAPEHERRVADPGVAVVPVALAPGCLRQGRGGRREHGAAGCVAEALQGQRAPLQVGAPRMVGEDALLQPAPPVVLRLVHDVVRSLRVGRRCAVAPGERAERPLAAAQVDMPEGPRAHQVKPHARRQPKFGAGRRRGRDGAVVVVGVRPPLALAPVVEGRKAVQDHLDVALDAIHGPQQALPPDELAGRAAKPLRTGAALPPVEHEAVLDDEPPVRGLPGGLQHERAGHVAALARHDALVRAQAKRAGAAVEHRAENAGRIRPGQAEPLHGPRRRDQGAGLAVRQERVVRDRWEIVPGLAQVPKALRLKRSPGQAFPPIPMASYGQSRRDAIAQSARASASWSVV